MEGTFLRGKARILSGNGGFRSFKGNSLGDFSGLNTARANFNAPYGSGGEAHFDTLKVGKKAPAGNTRDLLTNTTGLFSKTAPGNRAADNRFSIADCAVIHRAVLYPGLQGWQAVFSDIYPCGRTAKG